MLVFYNLGDWVIDMRLLFLLSLTLVLLTNNYVSAEEKNTEWPEAVFRLTEERSRVTICVSFLKTFGTDTEITAGQLAYEKARAQMDALVAGLLVVVNQRDQPEDFSKLEQTLTDVSMTRQALCKQIEPLIPKLKNSSNIISELVKDTLGKLIDALKELYFHYEDKELVEREAIRVQLEGARWPSFSDIQANL